MGNYTGRCFWCCVLTWTLLGFDIGIMKCIIGFGHPMFSLVLFQLLFISEICLYWLSFRHLCVLTWFWYPDYRVILISYNELHLLQIRELFPHHFISNWISWITPISLSWFIFILRNLSHTSTSFICQFVYYLLPHPQIIISVKVAALSIVMSPNT